VVNSYCLINHLENKMPTTASHQNDEGVTNNGGLHDPYKYEKIINLLPALSHDFRVLQRIPLRSHEE
jgi:hypothetical protein